MRRLRDTPVVHLELHTPDGRGAADVYAGLCGWRPEAVPTGTGAYLALDLGRRLGGGIVECRAARPVWLPYVQVAGVDEVTDRARDLGATVLLEPRDGPAGRRSVVRTPAGGDIAFWQRRR
jgi:predicted enzyme related to lactoylglutathione lyase